MSLGRGRPAGGLKKMFWDRIYPEVNTGCWIWAGPLDAYGYGQYPITVNGIRFTKTHRLSYYFYNKTIDKSLLICHSCDNRWCVNPDHLFSGTPKDNTQDCVKKGRFSRKKRAAKLSPIDVSEIKKSISSGHKLKDIAAKFKVTPSAISSINCGITWRDE